VSGRSLDSPIRAAVICVVTTSVLSRRDRESRKREPGETPGLPRSGERERKPSEALAHIGLGSDGN
jgi:hypothetical protein